MIRIIAIPLLTLLFSFTLFEFVEQPVVRSSKSTIELSYPEHLTGTFTGGFEEETCRSCHFDYDLNPNGGSLTIAGIPAPISVGETIEIKVTVEREELGAAGFQLTARNEDGSQAGRFEIEDNTRLMFSESVPDSLQYVQHTNEGTNPSEENKNSWTVTWKAPETMEGSIIFNISANAANGDQSEFGDFIYAEEIEVDF